jgi:hypothetical protein
MRLYRSFWFLLATLVGERHGIEKRLQTALHEFHERFLDGVLAGTTQHAVLQNMSHTTIIGRWGTKGDTEHLVVVVVFHHQQLGSGFHMLKL